MRVWMLCTSPGAGLGAFPGLDLDLTDRPSPPGLIDAEQGPDRLQGGRTGVEQPALLEHAGGLPLRATEQGNRHSRLPSASLHFLNQPFERVPDATSNCIMNGCWVPRTSSMATIQPLALPKWAIFIAVSRWIRSRYSRAHSPSALCRERAAHRPRLARQGAKVPTSCGLTPAVMEPGVDRQNGTQHGHSMIGPEQLACMHIMLPVLHHLVRDQPRIRGPEDAELVKEVAEVALPMIERRREQGVHQQDQQPVGTVGVDRRDPIEHLLHERNRVVVGVVFVCEPAIVVQVHVIEGCAPLRLVLADLAFFIDGLLETRQAEAETVEFARMPGQLYHRLAEIGFDRRPPVDNGSKASPVPGLPVVGLPQMAELMADEEQQQHGEAVERVGIVAAEQADGVAQAFDMNVGRVAYLIDQAVKALVAAQIGNRQDRVASRTTASQPRSRSDRPH